MSVAGYVFLFAATAFAGATSFQDAHAQESPAITGPFVYENLAAYFIHGQSAGGPVPLTLQEALDKGVVQLKETGLVNELKIENTGDEDVYIQAGDMVKGGRQDRVLTASFILRHKSGEVPVAAFCVEHGRWSARGQENVAHFASAQYSMPSREIKLAMSAPVAEASGRESDRAASRRQSTAASETIVRQRKVWDEVAKTQARLSQELNAPVSSPQSETSLELSMENEKLKELREKYTQALKGLGEKDGDIVGYAFAVNGRINSADVYPSNGLFRKMWEKLLAASITEAIAQKSEAGQAQQPDVAAVRQFLASAESGASTKRTIAGLAMQEVREAGQAVYVEAAPKDGSWIHKNYLAK